MRHYFNKLFLISFVGDLTIIVFAFFGTLYGLEGLDDLPFQMNRKVLLLILLVLAWCVYGIYSGLYKAYYQKKILPLILIKTYKGLAVQAMVLLLFYFLSGSLLFLSRTFVLFYILFLGIGFTIEKIIVNKVVVYLRKQGYNLRRVVLLGAGETAKQFSEMFRYNPQMGYSVVGYMHAEENENLEEDYLGDPDHLIEILKQHKLNEIILTDPRYGRQHVEDMVKLIDQAGIRIRIIPDFHYQFHNRYEFKFFGNIPTASLRKEPLEELPNRMLKRFFDVVFSFLVLLLICSWLFPVIAVLIRLNSRGPIFFKQKRLGRDQKEFYCYKFRSMYVNRDSDKVQATKHDNRITPIGGFLRKTSLDELPQFYNVLLGHMSVVGPRPHMMKHNEEYSKIINNYLVRQLIRPGITGWAQVNGYRGEIECEADIKNRVACDIWYLENWRFFLDLKIIFLTVWNVAKGEEKAY
ncbi:undecaprenyl-phosphate glucose phosphotransferase [Sinomicrobium sp. M5D2P17]